MQASSQEPILHWRNSITTEENSTNHRLAAIFSTAAQAGLKYGLAKKRKIEEAVSSVPFITLLTLHHIIKVLFHDVCDITYL